MPPAPRPTTTPRPATGSPRSAALLTQTETYDASGNQTGDGTVTYAYDARGRMSSAIAGGVTTSYADQRLRRAHPEDRQRRAEWRGQ